MFAEGYAAQKAQTMSANKSNATNVTVMPFDSNSLAPKLGAGATSAFAGDGAATQSNSFTGMLSVSVIRVFENGNLEVAGQKRLTLNNGNEYVRARGIIRPEDISASNMISSTKLADAEITYTGAGDVADTGRTGWASKILMLGATILGRFLCPKSQKFFGAIAFWVAVVIGLAQPALADGSKILRVLLGCVRTS